MPTDLDARPAQTQHGHGPVLDLTDAAEIRATVALAARGLSDREIARALDCSVRTVTRRFSGAMRHYGARSRFHLGFVIASVDDAARSTDVLDPEAGAAYGYGA